MNWNELRTYERVWAVIAGGWLLINLAIVLEFGGGGGFLAGALVMSWIVTILARRKGRSPVAWGAAGFLFGLGTLVVLAFMSKQGAAAPGNPGHGSRLAYQGRPNALKRWATRGYREAHPESDPERPSHGMAVREDETRC